MRSLQKNRTEIEKIKDCKNKHKFNIWNTESSKHFIKKITKEYRREIIQEGSVLLLGLADHLDEMVAKAMNVDNDFITLARQ